MPPLPPLPSVFKVVFGQEVGGFAFNNIMYLATGSVIADPVDMLALATAAYGAWQTTLLEQQQAGVTLESVSIYALNGTETLAIYEPPIPSSGSLGTNPGDMNKAFCLSWHIGAAYRGGKPRTYFCPVVALEEGDPRNWSLAATTNVALAAEAFRVAMNALTYELAPVNLGVVSYYRAGALRVAPVFYPYLGVKVNTRVASQRRRLGKLSEGSYVPG